MIFATDLDRTLIYSESFLAETKSIYRNIEIYKEKPISYISLKTYELLHMLHEMAHVVPVTTRNYEQYHRIEVFKGSLEPELYVINNGGTIYYHQQEDKKWTDEIRRQIEAMPVSYDEVLEAFLKRYKGYVERYKKSDELIWLVLGDKDQIDWEAVKLFEETFSPLGWRIDVNGRKIYLYPHFINKWAAVQYIKTKYWNEAVIAAGDSLFDYEMVHKADYGMVPKASWIEQDCLEYVHSTKQTGLEASEEILQAALSIVKEEQAEKKKFSL